MMQNTEVCHFCIPRKSVHGRTQPNFLTGTIIETLFWGLTVDLSYQMFSKSYHVLAWEAQLFYLKYLQLS